MNAVDSEVVIIPMTIDHLPGVIAVDQQSFTTPWSEESFVFEVVANDVAHYLVAMADTEVVGYGGVWIMVDEAHITNVAVHPAWRRRKIGERLMLALIDLAKKYKTTKMTLEVRKSNWGARLLYEKLGFVALGVRRNYYSDTKEDAIVMWKYGL